MLESITVASLEFQQDTIVCQGDWTAHHIGMLEDNCKTIALPPDDSLVINGQHIRQMDTCGAWVLQNCLLHWQQQGKTIKLEQFKEEHKALLKLMVGNIEQIKQVLPAIPKANFFNVVGHQIVDKLTELKHFITFIGQLTVMFTSIIRRPKKFHWSSIVSVVENTGYYALPIIGLLTFLIGVVLAYQMAVQLRQYGAELFIVDLTGIAILREFGPMIVAILVAGRSSSSFTAQIGTMKINEEIDALYTMGISPLQRLVAPKILGLIIVMPLLTTWANLFGVAGSMVMSEFSLDISYHDFLTRFQETIAVRHYLVGLVKTPVFAIIIAAVGCYQGLQVSSDAESVGKLTTKSVVQSIFLIIIADAAFSIYFSWQGI